MGQPIVAPKDTDAIDKTINLADRSLSTMSENQVDVRDSRAPPYADEETLDSELHLDSAADIVTQVIAVEDDPTLNPWTFRMFFIGKTSLFVPFPGLKAGRYRPFVLRCSVRGNLLLQTANYIRLCQ